ncbi:NAD(P)/FAD-dependent oxidoreductase [Metapseudomonas resinovorans]|uniref:Putative oxidoreductase n=1 Tax=Metapseudomonas resinovorans NBRC 106553 TaxID=1245471 RepID=S6ADG5_METRE|nr:NAD(P)/FAD-dependent oxidoreductase [Pseudomonas resinovorans]BAN47257.1 putative oxidoreductase [Pseudomonas resinovorans NBRC 106553]
MSNAFKAIIAGGGFGGLTAATALAQRGWSVTVYERQHELRASGSGIYIWENGLRILDAIGAQVVSRDSFHGRAMEQRDRNNQVIDPGDFPPSVRLVTVARKDLLNGLRDAALRAGVEIRTGAEVIGAGAAGDLHFAGARSAQADLAIGADGVWSAVRRALGLELFHQQTDEGALRAIIPGTQEDLGFDGQGKYIELWSGSRRLLITPLNRHEIYLAFTCQKDDLAGKASPLDKAAWIASFPHWAHLIERVDTLLPWAPYSIVKVKAWSAGRTALIGDAAHAQPPNLGQGGGMAMQSGLALATFLEDLEDRRDIPERLQAWEAHERELAEHCQRWSCLYGEVSVLPDDARSRIIHHGMADPWVRSQILRAAQSQPTGTQRPGQPVRLAAN